MPRRALISVYEKEGVDGFAAGLVELGWELVSSGGTATFLAEAGLPVTTVEAVTMAPEMLGGRVKTLHPRIHAGILARRELDEDTQALEEQQIDLIDLVCVSLYPFERAAADPAATEAEIVEMIDVGGPSMLRAAAKNFAHVTVVSSPAQYEDVLSELRTDGDTTPETRKRLAGQAFETTAAYEAAISNWFGRAQPFPEQLTIALRKVTDLSYGENPHQAAAYYRELGGRRHLLSGIEQLGGKELSYNNLGDLEGARRIARELDLPGAVIVKHANPCGVAVAATIEEAWERALAADPVSAFGCVAVLNRPVGAELGARIGGHFAEVLLAPGYDEAAVEALRARKALRILVGREQEPAPQGERDYKRVLGGLLVQDRNDGREERTTMQLVAGDLDDAQWADLLFAWRVCKHVSSNAIVLVRDLQTIGIGAGQMSRVDAVRIAVEKAREHGHETAGAALASDAYFPFADGPQIALAAGIAALIQPGGSIRDGETVAAVESAGAAMVLTGRRHFRH